MTTALPRVFKARDPADARVALPDTATSSMIRYRASRLPSPTNRQADSWLMSAAAAVLTCREPVRRYLEAGEQTFVEMPLAPTSELARNLIELATDRGLVLMCGYTFCTARRCAGCAGSSSTAS